MITIAEAAQNVLLGKYENGKKRRKALQTLGLDADAVQRRLNDLVKGAKAEYVTMNSGDTLSQIVERYGISVAAIIKLNSALIKNPDCIRVCELPEKNPLKYIRRVRSHSGLTLSDAFSRRIDEG